MTAFPEDHLPGWDRLACPKCRCICYARPPAPGDVACCLKCKTPLETEDAVNAQIVAEYWANKATSHEAPAEST